MHVKWERKEKKRKEKKKFFLAHCTRNEMQKYKHGNSLAILHSFKNMTWKCNLEHCVTG